ncbi:MAG: protein kinase/lanthionine synthetase C family protein [Phormidesmis sp. CAN_BIN44]|nr:protein kinase/lanthionine synthetase C family protein [Phormidesmis sp. CAN_BIN44]
MMIHNCYEWLEDRGVKVKLQGIWASVGSTTHEYGWKLHLSSIQCEAIALLEIVIPVLQHYGFPFKVARDSAILGMLNEGEFSPTQVGKFITIYPPTPTSSLILAEDLREITRDFSGPRIVTDLYIGGIVYTRYGSYNPKLARDRLGNITLVDPSHNGEYKVPFIAPEGIENPFSSYTEKHISDETTSQTIGPGYLILRPLRTHAKGSVYLALDLRRQEDVAYVILKEGRKYCVSDMLGRDIWDRLRHQEHIHKFLAGKVLVPSVASTFESFGNLYLPVQYIEGRDFGDRPPIPYNTLSAVLQRAFLVEFQHSLVTVQSLHKQGFIHRDLSPRNIRISNDGLVYLLDLELCYHINGSSSFPFAQGTPGFISPQQLAGEPPSFADDVYALGSLLINALTGFDPHRVLFARQEDREEQIQILSGAPLSLCYLASRCVHPKPERRPSLKEIIFSVQESLEKSVSVVDIKGSINCENKSYDSEKREKILLSLNWLIHESLQDEVQGLWLSPEIESSNHDATLRLPHAYRLYRSASRGVAGVVYAVSRLHRFGFSTPLAVAKVNLAIDWLLSHEATPDDQMPGLHFGEAGVAVAIAESVKSGLVEDGEWFIPYLHEALSGPIDWPDLTHGAAGQGIAALSCAFLLDIPDLAIHSHRCTDYLLEHQNQDGSWTLPHGVEGMERATYTGFAHGVAGIVYYLATYALHFKDINAQKAAEAGGRWLLEQARTSNDEQSLWWTTRSDSNDAWRWWCHGGPGIAIAFIGLFKLTRHRRYADAIRLALRIHPSKVCYSNLSQCHGLSGLGEILLEAYRVLGETEWLMRASNVEKTILALAREEANGICWLVENPFHPTADLMIGCSGVAHFLARMALPSKHSFGMPLLI